MKKGLSEIVCVLDRSGSMHSIINDAIGGFNSFLAEQKKQDGEARLTVAMFDDQYELLYDNVDIQEAKDLDNTTYVPRGMTALHDAIGRTMQTVGERLSKLPEDERPESVIFAVLTDGYENASSEYDADKVKDMIGHQEEKYSWKFLYLAANQDAFAVGSTFGFNKGNSFSFSSTGIGSKTAFANVSNYASMARCCMDVSNYVQNDSISEADVADGSCDLSKVSSGNITFTTSNGGQVFDAQVNDTDAKLN